MLIRFFVENFLSFRKRQTFSMLPGKMTKKSEHVTNPVGGIRALKAGVIFGANASGKSNLIKAIAFGQKMVLRGSGSENTINFQNFRLDADYRNKDSRLEYEIQYGTKNYAYGFVFNRQGIVEEWLYEMTKTSEKKVFERDNRKKDNFDLSNLIKKNKSAEERQFLKFIAKGTPDNQLFLTEIKTRKVRENVSDISDVLNVLDWFQNRLKVIFPNDKYNQGLKFEIKEDEELLETFNQFLDYFDTGISGVCLEKVDIEKVKIPNRILKNIEEDLLSKQSEHSRASILSADNTTYFISASNGTVDYHEFMTKHKVLGQVKEETFDTADESDGTNRIIDFIPLLMDLLNGNNVFIVDEMERSLHANLMYDLIDFFLSHCENINSQLILASHESTLLNQKLLRKDEIWFAVKNQNGASVFHSLEEYNVRFDKKILKDYLLGRFKAVPKIGNREKLTILKSGYA